MSVATSTRYFPLFEAGQRLGALLLRPVAVDPLDLDSLLAQVSRQPVCPVLGPGEDQRLFHIAPPQQGEEQRRLEILAHRVGRLGNSRPTSCAWVPG
jgi:hypothetical protein